MRKKTFGKLAVLSPSVGWDDKVILRQVEALSLKPPLRIWLDTGTAEAFTAAATGRITVDVRLLRDALLRKGWELETDLEYYEAKGAGHDKQAWARRIDPMLRYLFPRK